MLRFPHFLDSRLIDDGKAVSLTHPPLFTPKNISRDRENNIKTDVQVPKSLRTT
jgi:hypothetical protein